MGEVSDALDEAAKSQGNIEYNSTTYTIHFMSLFHNSH
jgi:hypothetical protein